MIFLQLIEDKENKKAAIETIKTLTKEFQKKGNCFDSYGEISLITGDIENSQYHMRLTQREKNSEHYLHLMWLPQIS